MRVSLGNAPQSRNCVYLS